MLFKLKKLSSDTLIISIVSNWYEEWDEGKTQPIVQSFGIQY